MVSLYPLSLRKKNEKKTLPEKKADKNVIITPLYERKETPCDACLSGSMTVEAAWILPLCVCFFVCILFIFRLMQVQIVMQNAVSHAAAELAVLAADENQLGRTKAWLVLKKELSETENVADYIEGGMTGIRLSQSDWSGNTVSLVADYQVTCPITVFGKFKISLVSKGVCHKWIGWSGNNKENAGDVWVYVTETGTVYHLTEDCSHLNLSIKSVSEGNLEGLRNEEGGKYDPCRLCATGSNPNVRGTVFITNQGNSYHYKLQCSGLKRTIYRIRLSAVGDKEPCSRCGGK